LPNLILIDCHDLGRHLGAYGWKSVRSPHLDALAESGVRFTNSFCTAPQCSPSRAALYTGRYPHANGMFGLAHAPFNWRLNPGEIHLARYLQDGGYATAQIGVQHVTSHDREAVRALGFQQVWVEDRAEQIAEQAVAFLNDPPAQPFFLNIGFLEPHRDSNGQFKQAAPDDSLGVMIPPYLPQTAEARQEFAELQGIIHQMDQAIGQIWTALYNRDMLKDTWIIFTTDHGIAMPRAKCSLYDPGIETALIMYAEPFSLVGGQVLEELISNVDLLPTIVDMLGLEIPDSIQGRSFTELLRQKPYTARQQIFSEKTFHTTYEPQRALRTDRYKLIWNVEAGILNVPGDILHSPIVPQMIDQITLERPHFELFDLTLDPNETYNLAANPDYRSIFDDLRLRLYHWMQETGDPILRGPITSPFYRSGLQLLTETSPNATIFNKQ